MTLFSRCLSKLSLAPLLHLWIAFGMERKFTHRTSPLPCKYIDITSVCMSVCVCQDKIIKKFNTKICEATVMAVGQAQVDKILVQLN
jgi:hypothetical protein